MAGMRFALVLALGALVGCGRSIRHADDGGNDDSGGGTGGSRGGTGGVSGAAAATTGGATTGGTAGTGGEPNTATRLFFESAGALVSTDFSGGDLVELCPGHEDWTRYSLVGLDGDYIVVYRERFAGSSGGLRNDSTVLRAALDGSAFHTVYSDLNSYPIGPVAGGRVVLITPPAPPLLELPAPEAHPRIIVPNMGLASIRTDGSGFRVLSPSGASGVNVVGERVIYSYADSTGIELYTSLADGSEREKLVDLPGSQSIGFVSGERVVVQANGDVFSVDPDGGRLIELATGTEQEYATGVAFDHVMIGRQVMSGGMGQQDLYAVPMNGGELVPLATGLRSESFAGASGDRVVFHLDYEDVYSVHLDGSDPVAIASSEEKEYVSAVEADRVFFTHISATGTQPLVSAALDGTDVVVLAEHVGDLAAIVGDRAIVTMGATGAVFSIPVTGGDPLVLADNPEPDSVVGRLGRTLIIQTGLDRGKIARIDADGSEPTELLSSGRYVGAITEGCGVVPSETRVPCKNP